MLPRRSVLFIPTILALALLTPARTTVSAQQPALPDVLAKASKYAAGFADASRMLVCEERGKQTFVAQRINMDGHVEYQPVGSRAWVVEVAVVASPDWEKDGLPWREFRDVLSQDGKVVRETSRLGEFATKPFGLAAAAAEPATNEANGVRLGRVLRLGFLPRITAIFLHASNQPRFDFKKGGDRAIEGVKTWEVRYTEKGRPTIVMDGDKPEPYSGSLWIDPATGAVLASVLRNADPTGVTEELTAAYKLDQATGLWLPSRIDEKMVDNQDPPSKIDGTITYANWHVVPRKAS